MNLKQTRLVTNDVARLTRFYETLTGAAATVIASGYVEFEHAACTGLAIADTAALRAYGASIGEPAAGHSIILDFAVDDVDAEYSRLKNEVRDWVRSPLDLLWGNRAMLFRDPDGNLINMFAPIRRAVGA
jgi:predicted enzyme related to lactoylglutathione lyase